MPRSAAARSSAIISALFFGGPYAKLIPMQPSPIADTSKPLFPSLRFFILYALGVDHHLDDFPLVHCPVTIWNAVKSNGSVEHSTGFDVALKNVRQEVLDVSTHRSRPAADRDIVVKRWLRSWNRLLLRNADAPHRATRTSDADRGIHRLFEPDAFQHRVNAVASGQFANSLHRGVASLTHNVCRAEILGECNAISMASQNDDLLSTKSLRGDDTAQSHSSIADNGHTLSWCHPRDYRGVVSGAHHV